MNRIQLLSEQVANQIAAGEVIERPASVVKELVENSIDAGAARITVEIERGGRQLVRVSDDGQGMSRDDALLCLERHATSKIRRAEDLAAVQTMGFRGEALPSIASVSRFVLTTRERGEDRGEGTQVTVHGGRIQDVRTAGHAPGTSVEVRQLFYNLPARRKFLRSEETERAHILHYLTLAALACPGIGFTLRQEGRTVWQLPPAAPGSESMDAVRERLRALLGGGLELVGVDYRQEEAPEPGHGSGVTLRVWGWLGAPGVARATRQDQHVFVNRRPVENRGLNHALLEGYHTALMKGRYPVCCLFLELDPAEVDVNVHPAKREVRFHREAAVRQAVATSVREALFGYHTRGPAAVGMALPPSSAEARTTSSASESAPDGDVASGPQPRLALDAVSVGPSLGREAMEGAGQPERPHVEGSVAGPGAVPSDEADREPPGVPVDSMRSAEGVGPRPLLQVPLRLIGVLNRLYVLFESDRGLVLMDQHAAHERVLYEQMKRRLNRGEAPCQRMLLPETIELSVRDAQFVLDHIEVLHRVGVGLSEFGERTFLLDGLPPFVRPAEGRRLVREVIDELAAAGRDVPSLRLGELVIARTVCRHAVKANDPLQGPELERLVEDLRGCEMPYTCPHGRPTLIEFSLAELERRFGRLV